MNPIDRPIFLRNTEHSEMKATLHRKVTSCVLKQNILTIFLEISEKFQINDYVQINVIVYLTLMIHRKILRYFKI